MLTPPMFEPCQLLANELLILIIHQCRGDQQTLSVLSLVSTMFHAESQPLLYRQLVSPRPEAHTTFIDTLTRHKPHLIKLITKYDSSNIDHMEHSLWTSMMDLIAQMDSLQELGLRIIDCDYQRAARPFRPVSTRWNLLKLIPETPRFKLRSLCLCRKAIWHPLGVGWWADLIQAHAETLEYLDLSNIMAINPAEPSEQMISYPRLETARGRWDVVNWFIRRSRLRVIDITDDIQRSNMSSTLQELTNLEGFSWRYPRGTSKAKARELFELVSQLHSVKYLGVAHELDDVSHLEQILNALPESGLESLQAVTLFWSSDLRLGNENYYHDIKVEDKLMHCFNICPSLRFIDIELRQKMGGDAVTRPHLTLYHRVELCRNQGQLHLDKSYSFRPDAILNTQQLYRKKHTFYFE